jgi:hypothetical protein
MTPADLVTHVLAERRAQEAEARLTDLLDDHALVDRGDAIAGLTVIETDGTTATLRAVANSSRIRPGDRLEITAHGCRAKAALVDLRDHGRELILRVSTGSLAGAGPWTARLLPTDLSALVLSALDKLQTGAPGWGFFKLLRGADDVVTAAPPSDPSADGRLADVEREAGIPLDDSQRDVVRRCLALPPALAVQGPPGTGKTAVLALVAELLARRGTRVLIVAPTHQAVNNALTTVHRLFPRRAVLKVGNELRREALATDIPCGLLEAHAREGLKLAHQTITGMTFLSALQHLILRRNSLAPNVVLVDEAGQLPLAHGACAGLMGAGSVLMFGDDMQMPPVFVGAATGDPYATSVFARFRSLYPGHVTMFSTTYRLNQALCDAIGASFYTDRLRSSPEAATRRLDPACAAAAHHPLLAQVLAPDTPLVWVRSHTPACTQLNMAEARLVSELLAAAIAGGLGVDQVAAVTPFRRQAMLIRNCLQARLGSSQPLPIVDTVERVQGMTVDLVAISACASDPDYIAHLAGFLLSPNRLNVAASRARVKVVLVASPEVLKEIPLEYDALLAQQAWRNFVGRAARVADLPGADSASSENE